MYCCHFLWIKCSGAGCPWHQRCTASPAPSIARWTAVPRVLVRCNAEDPRAKNPLVEIPKSAEEYILSGNANDVSANHPPTFSLPSCLCTSARSPCPNSRKLREMGTWRWPLPLAVAIVASAVIGDVANGIPTTLDGPFVPVTSPLDGAGFRGSAVDLPDSDPRVRRRARGFEPEQISVSLSATPDSVWISWVTGSLFLSNFVDTFR